MLHQGPRGMAVAAVDQGTGVHAGSLARPGRGLGLCSHSCYQDREGTYIHKNGTLQHLQPQRERVLLIVVPCPFGKCSAAAAAAAKSLQSCPRPHRWQPTRLPSPWDSPGKNTGVDCHFLLQCMKVKSESEVAQ